MIFNHLWWLLLIHIFWHFNVYFIRGTWPSSNYSSIQLLGLFQDEVNTSDPTKSSVYSSAMFKAAVLLSQQYNITIEGKYLESQTEQMGGNTIDALSATYQTISASNIVGIVGSEFSREPPFIADLAQKVGIPVISYITTAFGLSNRNTYHAFDHTVPSDYSFATAMYEPETFPESTKVNSYALFAFDATWPLIQSLHQYCSTFITSSLWCISLTGSSYCFNRRFLNSNAFFDTINSMTFLGVSGPIQFNMNVTDRINGSYYFTQNSQTISNGMNFISVLGYSEDHGWQRYTGASAIIWPGDTFSTPTSVAKLRGVNLSIGVLNSVPYTIVSTVTDQFWQQKQTLTG
ncbi:unnamed protein product [Rotaria sp. Silwood2]|nr:unnamed protein product [Rotaria sp. Silwood2]CAF4378431.1 unnamed protein product [Rotaria sp. Silwood2]